MPASFVLSPSSVKQRGTEQDREPQPAHSTYVTIVCMDLPLDDLHNSFRWETYDHVTQRNLST